MICTGVLLLSALAAANPAERAEVQTCIRASTQGQELRDSAKLLEARAQFRSCAVAACPKAIRADCALWAVEADKAVPSVVVVVREGNTDVVGVTLSVDGAGVSFEGRPLELDPGTHHLMAKKGELVREDSLLVSAGEKNRLVVMTWHSPAPAVAAVPQLREPVPTVPPGRSLAGPVTLGAVGVAGIGVFAGVGAWGKSELNSAAASACGQARTCPPGTTDGVRAKYIVADVGLGVGLAAIAGAVLWYFAGSGSNAVALSTDGRGVRVQF